METCKDNKIVAQYNALKYFLGKHLGMINSRPLCNTDEYHQEWINEI
jgi:hypothetical protein